MGHQLSHRRRRKCRADPGEDVAEAVVQREVARRDEPQHDERERELRQRRDGEERSVGERPPPGVFAEYHTRVPPIRAIHHVEDDTRNREWARRRVEYAPDGGGQYLDARCHEAARLADVGVWTRRRGDADHADRSRRIRGPYPVRYTLGTP
ncbi:hypothetical protein tb265_48710 [Gemmatimonadetes bacterium T265]|nr:hypothetical protein tb265_48710 [Gemmatimonadetes bacterium T265]